MDEIRIYSLKSEQLSIELKEAERKGIMLNSYIKAQREVIHRTNNEWREKFEACRKEYAASKDLPRQRFLTEVQHNLLHKTREGIGVAKAVIKGLEEEKKETLRIIKKKKSQMECVEKTLSTLRLQKREKVKGRVEEEVIEGVLARRAVVELPATNSQVVKGKRENGVQELQPETASEKIEKDSSIEKSSVVEVSLPSIEKREVDTGFPATILIDSRSGSSDGNSRRGDFNPSNSENGTQRHSPPKGDGNQERETPLSNVTIQNDERGSEVFLTYKNERGEEFQIGVTGRKDKGISIHLKGDGEALKDISGTRRGLADAITEAGINLRTLSVIRGRGEEQ